MKIHTTAKTALGAAIVGFIFTTIDGITFARALAELGSPGGQAVLAFLASLRWTYMGLIAFLYHLIFRPQSKRRGIWALGAGAAIQLAFSFQSVYFFFSKIYWYELLGGGVHIALIGLVVPTALLAFAILWGLDPGGLALRVGALVTTLALLMGILYQVLIFGQIDVFSIFDAVSAALVAQWFWVLFLEWKTMEF